MRKSGRQADGVHLDVEDVNTAVTQSVRVTSATSTSKPRRCSTQNK
jgi:hypothetical protein